MFNAMHVTSVGRIFFLGITACRNFFLDKLPLQEFFLVKVTPHPPPAISNGPSLTADNILLAYGDLSKRFQVFLNCSKPVVNY